MTLNRCCTDTLKHYAPRQPIEGLEIACRWCTGYLRYERINDRLSGWMPHERTKDFVAREATPAAVEAREIRYTEMTDGRYDPRLKDLPATRVCARCAAEGRYEMSTIVHLDGTTATYRCVKDHQGIFEEGD